jgi:hypothetical protein
MTDRERLPNRRVSELVDFEHAGRRLAILPSSSARSPTGRSLTPSSSTS